MGWAVPSSRARVLIRQGYLKAIIKAGPVVGTRALRRLAKLLADPLVTGIDPADLEGVTEEHLARIAKADWAGLAYLMGTSGPRRSARFPQAARLAKRGRRLVDVASGRTRHRRIVTELKALRRSVEEISEAQRRLEENLQAEFQLRDMLTAGDSMDTESAMTPRTSD